MEEEKILYKNSSKMDDEEIIIFQNYALKKTLFISSIVFTLIFIAVGIGTSFFDLTMGIVFIVCGLLGGFVLLPYLIKENVKKQNKTSLGDKRYLNTFEFYEDYIFVESKASAKDKNEFQQVATQKVLYKDVFKIVVYREFLFIFLNARQSLILNFKGMTFGTAGEMIEFLKTKSIKFVDKSNENTPKLSEK